MNAQIKKFTQAFPAFRLRLVDNKRWALMAGVGLAVGGDGDYRQRAVDR
ncbi:hypothetical protein QT343_25585 [Escherichia coli]|nr:hypothetical protein [Escherichia coli]